MDTLGGISGPIALGLLILREVYTLINHRRIRSKCCGKEIEASVDIEATTPPAAKNDEKV